MFLYQSAPVVCPQLFSVLPKHAVHQIDPAPTNKITAIKHTLNFIACWGHVTKKLKPYKNKK